MGLKEQGEDPETQSDYPRLLQAEGGADGGLRRIAGAARLGRLLAAKPRSASAPCPLDCPSLSMWGVRIMLTMR